MAKNKKVLCIFCGKKTIHKVIRIKDEFTSESNLCAECQNCKAITVLI